jgi:hypothetical protein
MQNLKNLKLITLILLSLFVVSCNEDEVISNIPDDSGKIDDDIELLVPDEPVDQSQGVIVFSQNFESFSPSGNWFLSDFGIDRESPREDFVNGQDLKFAIEWTKRTRNAFAAHLNIDKKEFTKEMANDFCSPKIEIGKEHVYGQSSSDNLIAELDTSSGHCGVSGSAPAAVQMYSFVPTKIGYKYNISVDYKMRNYGHQSDKSFKDLVVRFGSALEKFDPHFNKFNSVNLEMIAMGKHSKVSLADNGLPNGYGVLVDNIVISELGKADNYDSCAALFNTRSKGFKKCLKGEVDTNELCHFDDLESVHVNYKEGQGVPASRKHIANAFNQAGIVQGDINFLSLGLKGRATFSCMVDGYKGLFDVFEKTLSFQEVSWGNATPQSYPELAKVRVKLEECDEEALNRVVTIGTVATSESFSYTFDENEDGVSYSGCKMSKFFIKDITPNGPSIDGIDINSIKFE